MNRSKLWGFEVGQIVAAFIALTGSNIACSTLGLPLLLSWLFGVGTLLGLRVVSLGQKDGHLELTLRFMAEPHLFLGHKERRKP
jgi:hypothetical protein